MRPNRGAGGEVALAGAAEADQRAEIVAEHADAGKQADALTRLGEMLKATPKATGGQPYQATGSNVAPVDRAPTLADLGIDKKVSQPGADKQAALHLWCVEFAVNLQRADVSVLALGFVGVAS